MEKLPGEAKDIAYHQNCNKYEYYFSGDRQLFEVLYNLNLHQYLNMTILILLLPGGGVPQRGGGGRKKTFPLSPILSVPDSQNTVLFSNRNTSMSSTLFRK